MVQYIYFVKCPNCEDEHFDFFDEAKEFALGCLGSKPVITQVEVCRNDFGECTDSIDHGVQWSWEDEVNITDEEPVVNVFTKSDFADYNPDADPEFDALDNSVDFDIDDVPDNFQNPTAAKNKKLVKENFISKYDYDQMTKDEFYSHLVDQGNTVEIAIGDQGNYNTSFADAGVYSDSILEVKFESGTFSVVMWNYSDDGDMSEDDDYEFNTKSFDELWKEVISFKPKALAECTRKAIPEGMTIEQLVEEMEENEDTVECGWCNELFEKSECRFEVGDGSPDSGLGWLCSRCEAAIKSRGETLTFRENNYWDFLDESASGADISLEEAYRNIINLPDAKEQILNIARLDVRALRSIDNNNNIIPARAYISSKATTSGQSNAGVVTDFYIDNSGELIVYLDRENGHVMEISALDLLRGRALTGNLKRDCVAYKLIQALMNAARELDRRTGVTGGRNLNAIANVRANPEAANELKNHIVKIVYKIPKAEYSTKDFIDFDDEWAEKAAEKLTTIKDNFNAWDYSGAADTAGMVVDRPAIVAGKLTDASVSNIANNWAPEGKITFDCRVSELSEDAQKLIKNAKVSGKFDDIKNKKEIDCIRLAKALTEFFNDVKFYETKTIPDTSISYTIDDEEKELLTAGLDSSVLKETLNSDAVTWICNFNGKAVGTVEAETEEEALEKMQLEYPEYNYGKYDGCFEVYPDIEVF